MRYPLVRDRIVLITGCSSGIGRATAHVLRARGWQVFPTARKPTDLETLRAAGFQPIELDIASDESVARAASRVLELSGGKLGALVNNAGFVVPGAAEDLTREALRRQFEVNVFGAQDLTNRFVSLFRHQGFGRIVNVSSMLARIVLPFLGAYSASKFALSALSTAMRMELRGSGVAVSLIEPGPVDTAIHQNAAATKQAYVRSEGSVFDDLYRDQILRMQTGTDRKNPFSRPPESVAIRIAHALESPRPRRRYRVTVLSHFGAFMARFASDGLLDLILSRRLPAGR